MSHFAGDALVNIKNFALWKEFSYLETKNGLVPQESGPASHHDSITVKGLISLHTIGTSNAYTCLKLLNIKGF